MKLKNWIGVIFAISVIASCDDSLGEMGTSMIPTDDLMTTRTEELNVTDIHSFLAGDSINAKSTIGYLGKFTDSETNTIIESDFISQFYCREDYGFPSTIKELKATKVQLRMYYNSFFGDSTIACRVNVYPLTKVLKENTNYYTNINPADWCDDLQNPIATAAYSAHDYTVSDDEYYGGSYYPNVTAVLPTEIGTDIIKKYFEVNPSNPKDSIGKTYFSNANMFINNVFKGLYVKSTMGDGTILNIDDSRLEVYFEYYQKSQTGLLDSLVTGVATFPATSEVLQVNKFKTQGLEEYMNKNAQNDLAVIHTPAGIFTEITLPISDVSEKDTLNSAMLVLEHINSNYEAPFKLSPSQTLLMIRKKELYTFFDNNKVFDNVTSFIATRNSDTSTNTDDNRYTYSNISNLIRHCQYERNTGMKNNTDWESKNPDWNKVVLIPITYATSTVGSSTVVTSVTHDLSMGNVLIKTKDVKLKLIYNRFNNSASNK